MKKALLLPALAIALAGAGSASSAGGFSANVTNPWFPLKPGTVYTYDGIKDGKRSHEKLTPTNRVKMIQGKPCRVVEDRLYVGGALVERTSDWYSQDSAGNVWYFGEDTAELEGGKVTTREGTWQAGVDGARGGILMPAQPRPARRPAHRSTTRATPRITSGSSPCSARMPC